LEIKIKIKEEIKMKNLAEKIREMAHRNISKLKYSIGPDPISTLKTVRFNIPFEQSVNQDDIVCWNLELDTRSCFGRVAQAAAVVEKHFPNEQIYFAEVWEDALRNILLKKMREKPAHRFDPSFMEELLMYEEPHAVLLIDGVQFDPLSNQLGFEVIHPRVEKFSLWKGIASSHLVSVSHKEADPEKKLATLEEAERICPGTTVVRENLALPLELLGRTSELIETVEWCLEKRLCARTLYVAHMLTGKSEYYNQLIKMYSEEVVKYF
jgi:hypothetical protein